MKRSGALLMVDTLLQGGVDTCFTNPGTSEMHFVAALDQTPEMRSVLCLQETVATGAADGYARMADKPAGTLLHLGPGLANGLANVRVECRLRRYKKGNDRNHKFNTIVLPNIYKISR